MNIFESQLFAAIVGGFFGILVAIITQRLQERRRIVEWDFSSTSLLVRKGKQESPLKLSIDKFDISGHESDKNTPFAVDNAYAFFVSIRNVGNETITNPKIEIKLNNSAKIIKCIPDLESNQGYEIPIKKKNNIAYVEIPYLNPKGSRSELKLDIISIDNHDESCVVTVDGPGIEQKRRQQASRLQDQVLTATLILVGMFLASIVALVIIVWQPSIFDLARQNLAIAAIFPAVLGLLIVTVLTLKDRAS